MSSMWISWAPGWLQNWLTYLGFCNKRGRLVRIEISTSILVVVEVFVV